MQKLDAVGSAILLLALGLASGCGDAEPEGAGTAPGWSIPDDAVIGTLTDAQKETLCKETEANLTSSGTAADAREASCRLAGFLAVVNVIGTATDDASLKAACQPAYDECAAMAGTVMCTPPTETCKATMQEYRACLDEARTVSDTGLMVLPPCEELTLLKVAGILAQGMDLIPKTPACTTFRMKCPDLKLPVSTPTPPI